MSELKQLVPSLVTIGLFVITLAIAWGKMKERTLEQKKDLVSLKRGLYREDGTLVYVTEEHCETLQKTMCNKIDEVKGLIEKLEIKIEDTRKTQGKEMQKISEFIGRVDQYMRGRNDKLGQN